MAPKQWAWSVGKARIVSVKPDRAHLAYRREGAADLQDLSGWLPERALEHDAPDLLARLVRFAWWRK